MNIVKRCGSLSQIYHYFALDLTKTSRLKRICASVALLAFNLVVYGWTIGAVAPADRPGLVGQHGAAGDEEWRSGRVRRHGAPGGYQKVGADTEKKEVVHATALVERAPSEQGTEEETGGEAEEETGEEGETGDDPNEKEHTGNPPDVEKIEARIIKSEEEMGKGDRVEGPGGPPKSLKIGEELHLALVKIVVGGIGGIFLVCCVCCYVFGKLNGE